MNTGKQENHHLVQQEVRTAIEEVRAVGTRKQEAWMKQGDALEVKVTWADQ